MREGLALNLIVFLDGRSWGGRRGCDEIRTYASLARDLVEIASALGVDPERLDALMGSCELWTFAR